MKKLLFVAFLFSLFSINAQSYYCGTVDDGSMMERLEQNKKAIREGLNLRDDSKWLFIPIEFHVVSKSDGSGGIDENKIWMKSLI